MLLLLAVVWMTAVNVHFGWNRWPQSSAELICDGIGLLMTALWWARRMTA